MEKNSRLWSTINIKDKGCGESQDQEGMNMEAEEGHGEKRPCQCPVPPGGMQGAGGGRPGGLCPGGVGTGPPATGLPHFRLLLPPGDVNGQFSWSQQKADGGALVSCRALF